MALIIKKWIQISLLIGILSTTTNSVKINKVAYLTDCPVSCKCLKEEIRCRSVPVAPLNFKQGIERIVFEEILSCNDESIFRILEEADRKEIEVIGTCLMSKSGQPRQLKDITRRRSALPNTKYDEYRINEGSIRIERATFNGPSVYGFNEKAQYYTNCTFDQNTCDWRQLTNIDMFDWSLQAGKNPGNIGPENDHTQGLNGFGSYLIANTIDQLVGSYADFLSPPLVLPYGVIFAQLTFYYFLNGDVNSALTVYEMYPRISPYLTHIVTIRPNNTAKWLKYTSRLYPLSSDLRIIFRGIAGARPSAIAIDDVSITPIEFVCYTGNGKYYTGLSSKTSSGLSCQRWSSQFPHQHNFKPSLYPDAKLNQNYCRNPLGTRSKPWCFTTAPNVTWEYCNISICDPPLDQKNPNVLGSKYPLKLVNRINRNPHVGLVALYHNGRWSTICNDGISTLAAQAICAQTVNTKNGAPTKAQFAGVGTMLLRSSNIKSCPNPSSSLDQCTVGPLATVTQCGNFSDLWLDCSDTIFPTLGSKPSKDLSVSLTNGRYQDSGFITVTNNSVVSGICVKKWDSKAADVACRQMGYLFAGYIFPVETVSNLTTSSWISDLSCIGYESSLSQCKITYGNFPNGCPYTVASAYCETGYLAAWYWPNSCKFRNGFCGWRSSGALTWTISALKGHYDPASYVSAPDYYIYLVMTSSTSLGKTTLTSPRMLKNMNANTYVTLQLYLVDVYSGQLNIRNQFNPGSQNHVYSYYMHETSLQRNWTTVTSRNITGRDIVIIIEWTVSKNPSYPLVKVIAIKDLQVKGIAKYIEPATGPANIGLATGFIFAGLFIIIAIVFVIKGRRNSDMNNNTSLSMSSGAVPLSSDTTMKN